MVWHFLHLALANLGFMNDIQPSMQTFCILMLYIISRQQFSVNSVSPFMAAYRHLPHFLLIYGDIGALTYYPWLSQTSSSLSLIFFKKPSMHICYLVLTKPVWIAVSSPGDLSLGNDVPFSWIVYDAWTLLIMGKYSVFLWTTVKKYPWTITLKLSSFLKMNEFPFGSWILRAGLGPFFLLR